MCVCDVYMKGNYTFIAHINSSCTQYASIIEPAYRYIISPNSSDLKLGWGENYSLHPSQLGPCLIYYFHTNTSIYSFFG